MKKGFTLIELLVVIAIIAILAAILFPVFAQAKLAAKKTASLSNIKQIGLSEMIYQNDYDDNFVLDTQKSTDAACPSTTSPSYCVDGLSSPTFYWPNLLIPYIKTLQIYVDPATGDSQGLFGSGNLSWAGNWNFFTQYNYNYEFLSPWWQCKTSLSENESTDVKPAETVMFTSAQGFGSGGAQYQTPDYSQANAPGTLSWLFAAVNDCVVVAGTNIYESNWSANNPPSIGVLTADVRTMSPYQGANVLWVDGHAKNATAGALAVGTDFGTASYSSGNYGATITDFTKYLWSLDETSNSISQ